jgi:hypothetical protein
MKFEEEKAMAMCKPEPGAKGISWDFNIYNGRGEFELSEREQKADDDVTRPGHFTSTHLIDAFPENDMSLGVAIDSETEGMCRLQVCAFHIANEETGRVFHASLAIDLGRPQLQRLHAFLGLLLSEVAQSPQPEALT